MTVRLRLHGDGGNRCEGGEQRGDLRFCGDADAVERRDVRAGSDSELYGSGLQSDPGPGRQHRGRASVTNHGIPILSTATVDGTALVLTYDGALDPSSRPAASAFTVRVATVARAVSSVAISGSAVTLTLSSAVTSGQAVTVSYTVPDSNPIQNTGDHDAAAFTNETVTNNTAPILSTATVDGTALVLTYDGALDPSSRPAASAFAVRVATVARAVSSVAISGTAVTLTLSSTVTSGQAVTVSYTVPATNPIQNTGGHDAAAFTNETVTNNTAPILSTATVDGTALVLTYDGALDPSSRPAASAFTVRVGGSPRTVSAVAISGTAVTLTLSSRVMARQTVIVSYAVPATNRIRDVGGNNAAAFTNRSVTNDTTDITVPVLSAAAVNGFRLTLIYSEALDEASIPGGSAFTVRVDGTPRSVSTVSVNVNTVQLIASPAVTSGQTVTVSYVIPNTNRIQDVAGNDAALLSNQSVANSAGDSTAPTLSSATVVDATLTLTYSETLDPLSRPATGAFTVTVGGSPRPVSAVAVIGNAVTLTLSSFVTSGQAVTLSYAQPATNRIQDVAGNDAAALTNEPVANSTADSTAPVFSSAEVNGAVLTLTYSETLDPLSRPAANAFTVMVADSARAVSTVAISGSVVTLTLLSAVTAGQTVTLSYAVPNANPIRDAAGNNAVALMNQEVTNNTSDTTAPVFSSAAVNGSALVLTYNEALDTSSTPAAGDFTVTVAGGARAVSGVAISGSAVTLTLSSAVTAGQAVRLSYAVPSSNPIQDAAGNGAVALTNQEVTNNTADTTAPVLSTATVSGTALVLTYDEALDANSRPATSVFTVTITGGSTTVSGVAISGSVVTLTLSSAVTAGQTVTVSYAVPGSNPIQDAAGNDAAALTNRAVTNNTSDTTAPTLSTATVNGTTLVLTYSEALNTALPAVGAFTVTVANAARTVSAVTISGSAVTLTLSPAVMAGETVVVSYAPPPTNPIRDAAGNGAVALTNQEVTNNTADTTAPTLSTATVVGAALTLTYNEALNTALPAVGAFTVTITGGSATVNAVSISGSAVTLTLSPAVTAGETVVVSYTVPTSNPIRDLAGNEAAALKNETVTNNTSDTTAPTLSTATVDGTALVLTYNEALNTALPATGAFTVTVANAPRAVSAVAISGSAVTLTLSPAVTAGETVVVSYTVPNANPLRDLAGNEAAALTNETVTNNTSDTTAPTLSTATVDGTALVLTYSEALNTALPAAGAFTVTVANAPRAVSAVAISGSVVTLTLSPAVTAGETVVVSYAPPPTNPIRDAAGNGAVALTNQEVTNNTADTTAPTLSTATVVGSTLTLTYNEPLDGTSTPAAGAFTVTVTGGSTTVNAVAISGSVVTLTLSSVVTAGQAVRVSYTPPSSNRLQDLAGNVAAALTNQAVMNNTADTTDTTAPVFSTAVVVGTTLTLTYSEALNTTAPATSAFTVTVTGGSTTVNAVAISGSVVTLTLSSVVTAGQTVRLSYTVPSTNPIQDAAGNVATAFTNETVTNSTAPVLSTVTVSGATLVLTYDGALDTASVPAADAFTVMVAGAATTVRTVAISGRTVTLTLSRAVTAGQSVTLSYAPSGTNPIQDAAGNALSAALSGRTVANNTPDTADPPSSDAVVSPPPAWLGRFGRTVAEQALDGISNRLANSRTAGMQGTLAGIPLDFGGSKDSNASAKPSVFEDTDDASRFGPDGITPSNPSAGTRPATLIGSRFSVTDVKDSAGGTLALWGRISEHSFDGTERGDGANLRLDGKVTNSLLGVDYADEQRVFGIALSQSSAKGNYASLDGGTAGEDEGRLEASLTAAIPYASLRASERIELWGALGYGTGQVMVKPESSSQNEADTKWLMAAGELRSELMAASADGAPSVALTSDALWTRMRSEKTDQLASTKAHTTRLRVGLEGIWRMALEDDAQMTAKLELGGRRDGGDVERGFGVELGGAVGWQDPQLGLSLNLSGRRLMKHEDDDFKDRGWSASVVFDPKPATELGASASLRQDWGGRAHGVLDALFAAESSITETEQSGGESSRWTLEAAYGLPVFGGRFAGSPYAGIGGGAGTRDYRAGWRLTPESAHAPDVSFNLSVGRTVHDRQGPEHDVSVEMISRW